ncbi:hypothetical protein VNO78_30691 [Psophocarpus tetragonolobus]|uniref:Uncharacterized protein n=1 Tax=Psophocarpus tetragonolobus TaxID=3891 RepID=A0AAN9RXU0_PSOTE
MVLSKSHSNMFPNLDLILLTLLHGSFVIFVLFLIILITLLVLLFAFSLALFSVFLFDLHHFSTLLSQYFKMAKDDLHLGSVLILISLTHQALEFVTVPKPWQKRRLSEFEVKVHHYSSKRHHYIHHGLKNVQ